MAKKAVKKATKKKVTEPSLVTECLNEIAKSDIDISSDIYNDLEKELPISNHEKTEEIPNAVYMKISKEEPKVLVPVVSVNYFGRYGNNLFQYVAARLFAEKNGYKMINPPPSGFLTAKDHPESSISDEVLESYTRCLVNIFDPVVKDQATNFWFNSYFQDSRHFNPYRAQIKEMFDLKSIHKNTEDIVVHLRLTDYFWIRNKWVISPLWYIQLIKKEKYRNCYIVVEPHVTNKEYLKYFENIKGVKIVTGNTAEEDFEFIRSFDRIICSNSTFCWWAAFLSDASKIYTFKPWVRDPKVNLSDIPNGKAIPGEFFRIKKLENLDWKDYWKK